MMPIPLQRSTIKRWCVGVFAGLLGLQSVCVADDGNAPDFTGRWHVTVTFGAETASTVLVLKKSEGKYIGTSGPLDEGGHLGLTYEGTVKNKRLRLIPSSEGISRLVAGPKSVGVLDVGIKGGRLIGQGTLYSIPVAFSGMRPQEKPPEPRTHDYVPTRHIRNMSGRNEAVLHIYPGDSVRTKTIDATGLDENRQWASMPGNPHTGPFYVEGAMPGDTLVVQLTRLRINQPRAEMVCGGLAANVLPAGEQLTRESACDWIWRLDGGGGIARPNSPSSKLKNFQIPLRPMIGSIGVAPPWNSAISTGDLGSHGGNLDYNRITEGVTLYLPVFRAGALLSLGDAHAAQGDGEITGQGLETSMDVEFKVDLIKGKAPKFPWAEDAEYVMFSGIGNQMDQALQAATAGLVAWLKDRYQLGTGDIAMLLGTSIQYDIAEALGHPHIVAKLRKDVVGQLQKPEGE
jgi:amidase